jgi:steroid Delta-isomerase
MSAEEMRAVVERYYACVDADDVEGVLDLFAADAVYRRPGYEPLVGRDALEDFYRHVRIISSGAHVVTHLVCGDDSVAVEGTFSGTLKDGSSSELEFADFFVLSGPVFQARTTYFYQPLV